MGSGTIGVSGVAFPACEGGAGFCGVGGVEVVDGDVVVGFPEVFKRFYMLGERHFSVSVNDSCVLVGITGQAIRWVFVLHFG